MDFLYPLSGFAVGLLVGLTGVGGGSLMTPILVLLFGVQPATAVGTDLLYAAITKAGGTLVHGFKGTVDWTITRRLASGSVPAALVTLVLLSVLGIQSKGAAHLISVALGFALVLTAASILFRQRLIRFALAHADENRNPAHTARMTVVVGALIGVLVTISSVGAGAIGVTALFFLYPRLATVRIVASDIAHAVPLTLVAGLGHWILGSVNWGLLGLLLIGSLPGIFLGSHLATRVPEKALRPLLAGTLLVVGAKLIAA